MFGSLGGTEILVILVLALLLFGPRRLPQIGQTLGKALSEFRRATHEFRSSLEQEVEVERLRDTKRDLSAVGREMRETISAADPQSRPGADRPREDAQAPSGVGAPAKPDPGAEDAAPDEEPRPAAEPPTEDTKSRDGESS